jgi:hypothetical protein
MALSVHTNARVPAAITGPTAIKHADDSRAVATIRPSPARRTHSSGSVAIAAAIWPAPPQRSHEAFNAAIAFAERDPSRLG